jgi:hypothetical protein
VTKSSFRILLSLIEKAVLVRSQCLLLRLGSKIRNEPQRSHGIRGNHPPLFLSDLSNYPTTPRLFLLYVDGWLSLSSGADAFTKPCRDILLNDRCETRGGIRRGPAGRVLIRSNIPCSGSSGPGHDSC